ncbi:MAG: DUF4982 domain-containing protein [Treponema sp.]|jgi:beta-galactosidase|nr:DUF4982 domain-containing protein [Treponema sp.]
MPAELWNNAWKFLHKDGEADLYAALGFDDAAWKLLVLPHDWGIEYPVAQDAPSGGGGGYAVTGIGWYRKKLHIHDDDISAGSRIAVRFDGIFMNSTVYVNGIKTGGRAYGYSQFTIDITDFLVTGENIIAVRVDNSMQPNSRWYTGSGIYRNVWLIRHAAVHIADNGVFAACNGLYNNNGEARIQIQAAVHNQSGEAVDAGVEHHIFDAVGNEAVCDASALHIEPGCHAVTTVCPQIKNPRLWSVGDPYLYTVETSVLLKGKVIDKVCTRSGIRTVNFDREKGFLLNGVQVKIKGMCLHHDGGLTGAAFYRETWKRRLTLLKDMGCNGIRCAHNPPAPEFLDLCDEMGFLVMDEAFDEWQLTKFKSAEYGYTNNFAYGYGQFFTGNADADLLSMLRRDRNHPSVVIWSIGNEIPEQSTLEGIRILYRLKDLCHHEDPTRMVTSAMDNIASPEQFRTCEEFECALDVAGYNYTARWGMRAETLYDEDRRKFPARRFLGTENPSAGGIRGNYEKNTGNPFMPSYDRLTLNHEFLWRYTASRDFVAGDYLWTGIDYLGETHWPAHGAGSGPIDTAGFPKDTFYYFRSIWNKNDTTLHICPHWNWAGHEGEFITVIGYTDCDEVSLYLNGRLIGTKGYDCPNVGHAGAWNILARNTRPTTHDLHLSWDVPYEAGELRAVGCKDGRAVIERVVKTTGIPVRLRAEADTGALPLYGIAHVEISVLDNEGMPVPTADTLIKAHVEGAGGGSIVLLGLDNGNLVDNTPFGSGAYAAERRFFAGRLLCVIRGLKKGTARLVLSADAMEDETITFTIG